MEKCILENLHIVDNAALPVKGEAFNACWVDKSSSLQQNLNIAGGRQSSRALWGQGGEIECCIFRFGYSDM